MSKIEDILLYLYDCVDSGFSYRMKAGLGINKSFNHWKKEEINNLSKEKLITKNQSKSGDITLTLTEKGRFRALNIRFKNLQNNNNKWDGKWRMVAFDLPLKYKSERDAIRYKMKIGGFYKLQDSIFISQQDCKKEIMALIEMYNLKEYVRFGVLDFIDNADNIVHFFARAKK